MPVDWGQDWSSSSFTLKHLLSSLFSFLHPLYPSHSPPLTPTILHSPPLTLSILTLHPSHSPSSHSPPLTLSTHPSLTLSTHSHALHRLQAWYEKQKQVVIKTAVEREAFINFAFFYAEAFARVRLVKKTCFIQKANYRSHCLHTNNEVGSGPRNEGTFSVVP